MRVTNQMVAGQTMRNISDSMRRLDRYNQQLSTGKRISLPSDDPTGTEIAMRLQTSIVETRKYIGNAEEGIAWLNTTDSALGQITEALQRARVLAVNGSTDTLSDDSRHALAMEVDQLAQDILQVANFKHGQKYLFGGENTLTPPFEGIFSGEGGESLIGFTYHGTSGNFAAEPDPDVQATLGISHEIGPGITMGISIHGDLAIAPAVEALINLRDHLEAGNVAAINGEDPTNPADPRSAIERIDDAIDTVLAWRSQAGARANRLELVKNRLQETEVNLVRLLSEKSDVDIAQTIMDLKMEENVYRLALASGARIIQPTLLDFLR